VDEPTVWHGLIQSGKLLLQASRFGQWQLPPDWLDVQGTTLKPADSQEFGYNALRIPLYLLWAGDEQPELLAPFREFWQPHVLQKNIPPTVNLVTGKTADYAASKGIACMVQWTLAPLELSGECSQASRSTEYYSAVLGLLTSIAHGAAARKPSPSPLLGAR
jgi:endoglucanase